MNEIGYTILPQLTLEKNCLVIELVQARKENHSYLLTPTPYALPPSKWQALASHPVDKEVLAFLIKEELLFQKRASGKTHHADDLLLKQVHISPSQLLTALELLAPTHRLLDRKSVV